ncbi:penicillin-binding protein [Arsenicicoccus dermatophilus]|uniref:penicillin-binding protein n=1 Tax=Arsenicicoccus dermatophilus TaxID=1076331 RepID=UPI0039170CAA
MSRSSTRARRRGARRRPTMSPVTGGLAVIGLAATAGLTAAAALMPVVAVAGGTANAVADYWASLPSAMPIEPVPQRSTILAADGSVIATFFSENRVEVPLAAVSPIARKAVVAVEDDRFYQHGGVDPRGILRAALHNAGSGGTQGGSTLTQQYVKNVLVNNADSAEERARATASTIPRKAQEAKIAAALEQRMTKDQVLQGYLNIAYYGDGAYGIGTAAQHFFSVPASRLTLPQAAMLAGLVQNPVGYNPMRHPKQALTRRNIVLARMRDTGAISAAEAAQAQRLPLGLKPSEAANGCTASRYPFYCQWVRQTLETDPAFGATADQRRRFMNSGLTIRTALVPSIADAAQRAADEALGRDNPFAAGVAVVRPGTGEVVAFAQNRSFGLGEGRTNQIYPVLPAFQPGSTFKPITYAAALEGGFPVDGVQDAPPRYIPSAPPYPPGGYRNSMPEDAGRLTAGQALARSSNTWFVMLEEKIGVKKVAQMANRLGLSLPSGIGAHEWSTTLGTRDASPVQMASVYAAFAAHGKVCRPIGIVGITGPDRKPRKAQDPACRQEIRPGVADAVTQGLAETVDGKDPFRTGKKLSIGRPVAGKTGTMDGNAAVWFAGYTPQLATAVWVGDPRGGQRHPIDSVRLYGRRIGSVFGATAAGPIWQATMKAAHEGLPVQRFAPVGPAELSGLRSVVPDVRGLSRDQAVQVVQASGFDVRLAPTTAIADPLLGKDVVVTQSPTAGSSVGLSGTVTLTLSAGSDLTVRLPPRR